MAKARKFSASYEAAFPNVLKSQETIESMMPGRAAAALPAKLARPIGPVFYPLLDTALVGWPGSWRWGAPRPSASDSKDESAYRYTNCCKDAHDRYPLLTEEWANALGQRSFFMEEPPDGLRILLIWDRRAALFVEKASSLACRSSSMSKSSP